MKPLQRAPGFWCSWRLQCAHGVRRLCMASDLTQLRERAALGGA
jgi:hypothetical protein